MFVSLLPFTSLVAELAFVGAAEEEAFVYGVEEEAAVLHAVVVVDVVVATDCDTAVLHEMRVQHCDVLDGHRVLRPAHSVASQRIVCRSSV